MVKKLRIVKHTVLDHFRTSCAENLIGKGVQGINVAEDKTGLPECAAEIFPCVQINGGFSSNGRIYRSQQGCGYLHIGDTPQVGCGGKAGEIAHNTTAKSNQAIGAGQFIFC